MSFLDPRSLPSTAEERAKRFTKKDPRRGLMSYMAAELHACGQCLNMIEPGDPLGVPKEDPKARWCWSCTSTKFLPALADYAEERRQCEREERLEAAILVEAAGDLSPAYWFTIAEANMGYREQGPELVAYVGELVGDFLERFPITGEDVEARKASVGETVRSRLWSFAPSELRAPSATSRLEIQPEDEPPRVTVENTDEPGIVRFKSEFLARVVIR